MLRSFWRGGLLVFVAAAAGAIPCAASAFSENFDSYATNSTIIGQGGWNGWDGALAANSTVVQGGLSAPNRIQITGSSDTIHQYSGYTSGKWVYRAYQFVPSTSVGDTYFILLNKYAHGGPYSWSVQLRCNASTHIIQDNTLASPQPQLPLLTDQWVEIRCEIDLTADTVQVYYNNVLLENTTWKRGQAAAISEIQCVDLYSDNASSLAYYDNIRLDPGGPLLAFGNMHTRLGAATIDVTGTGASRRLPVHNIGSSGQDGVAIDMGKADGLCLAMDPVDIATTQVGAQQVISLNGLPPGQPVTRIADFQFTQVSPQSLALTVDPGRSYGTFTIECYLEDQKVAESPGHGGGGGGPSLLQWPYWMESREKKECRPFHHHAIFVLPGSGGTDQGDTWIGLGSMDVAGSGIQLVTLPNGSSAMCNLIRLVPDNPGNQSSAKHNGYNVKANVKRGDMSMAGEMRYAFGLSAMSLGDNTAIDCDMVSAARKLVVSNIGSSGQDGVEFHSCPGNGFDAQWDPIVGTPVNGATLHMEAEGVLNGTHHRIGQTEVRYRPSFFDVFADFSDIGANTMHVIGRSNGAVVFDSTSVPNGLVGSSSIWPICGGKLGRPTPCFRWWWGNPFPFLRGGQTFLIDELLCLADGPPGTTLDNLDVLRFTGKDIPSLSFTDVQALEYKKVEITPTVEGCPDPAGQSAHYQVRDADTGTVVQEGDAPVGSDLKIIIEVWYKKRCIIHIEIGRCLQVNTPPVVLPDWSFFDMYFHTGDADGDNEIAIGDYALLSQSFGSSPGTPTWNPACDFDCDDEITIGDYALLSNNFGMVGDE